jgi:Membrane protein involved in the export of O-antigen and teichoic acid
MKINSIKMNASLNILYTVSNIVFPLVTFPYVSRILSADGLGKVSFFTAVANYAIMLASLGISTYGIRATAKVREDKKELSKVTVELFCINMISTAIVIVALLLSIPIVDKFASEKVLLFINIALVFSSVLGLNWLYSGLEQYSYITKRSIIFKIISLFLIFLFVNEKADYLIYAFISVFSISGSYILNLWYSKKFISLKNIGKLELKKHFKPMMILFASIFAVNIYTNLDTVMLGFISGDREVGLYTVSVKVKGLLLSSVNALSAVLLPRLSYYLSINETDCFNRILKKSTTVIPMIAVPLTAFFILETNESILLLGGTEFLDAALCMKIIMPILLISSFSNITGNQVLIPLGKDSQFMIAVMTGAFIDLLLNVLLIPEFGAVGAAVSTLIAECTQMAIQLKYTWNYIAKNIQAKSIVKIITATLGCCIITVILQNLVHIPLFEKEINTLINLGIYAFVYFVIYGIMLLLLKERYTCDIFSKLLNCVRKF